MYHHAYMLQGITTQSSDSVSTVTGIVIWIGIPLAFAIYCWLLKIFSKRFKSALS